MRRHNFARTRFFVLGMLASALLLGWGLRPQTTSAAFTFLQPGFTQSDFLTGFPHAPSPFGDTGPIGIAFAPNRDILVTDTTDGKLYRFPAAGGVATNGVQVGGAPTRGPLGLTFGADGNLYVASFTAPTLALSFPGEIDQIDPTSGAVIRIVAPGLNFPRGLATDPLSGDLFFTANGAPPTLTTGGVYRLNPVTGVVTLYTKPGDLTAPDGLVFDSNGILYVADAPGGGHVATVDRAGTTAVVATIPTGGIDGIAIGGAGSAFAHSLFVNRNDGVINQIDLGPSTPVVTVLASGGTRGDFVSVSPDGFLFATQSDRVIRIGPNVFQPPPRPNTITISGPASPTVPDGTTFAFTLAITSSGTPHKAVRWEAAYGAILSFVPNAAYTCSGQPGGITYPAEADVQPVESTIAPGVKNLGSGSRCSSLDATFSGSTQTGTFVRVTLRCDAPGTAAVALRTASDPATAGNDPAFGTTLLDAAGTIIPTTLRPQVVIPGFGSQAGFFVNCVNAPPQVNAGPNATINEGGTFNGAGSFSDPDSVSWTATVNYGDGSGVQPLALSGQTFNLSHIYAATGVYTVTVTVTDNQGATGSNTTTVTVLNVPPTVGPITAPVAPVLVNTAITASASFTDPGTTDTHTAVWNWGDGTTSVGTVTETNGSGSVTDGHTYTTAGVFIITLTVTDRDGGSGSSQFQFVVVFDPTAGFVTGGGFIDSPAGAWIADPTLVGRANFGFVSKYQKDATAPTGQTEFQFKVANLNFHSTSYQWLVIAGAKAQYKGAGTINGAGDFGFILTAIDGELPGGGGVDKFRIKIYDNSTSAVVYDNNVGAGDTADSTTAIAGGNITIHP